MRRGIAIAGVFVVVFIALFLMRSLADKLYFAERRQLKDQIKTKSAQLADYRQARLNHKKVKSELQGFVDHTLGDDLELVGHKLRTRLSRLAESAGMTPASDIKSSHEKESPAKSAFGRSGFQRQLREEKDFVEVEGWVSATGTLEQVLTLIESINAEPWLKRIDQLTIDPNDNGAKVQVNITLTTLFLPKQTPNPDAVIASNGLNSERYALLVRTNPFRLPPPAPNPPPVPAQSAPEAFPFGQWLLTGIAQSAAGPEIWLLNQHTRETKYLNIGERLNDIKLVAVRGETAEFLIGADRFTVAVGKNLNDRTPLKQ